MRVGQSHGGSAIAGGAELVADAAVLREHLREVLESPAFRGSRRCQQFLQHIVEKAISSHYDELKERILGVELFGRSSVYDTGEDAIVRVTASDVRKRLHQFYADTSSSIRIEIPSGSYGPEFRRVVDSPLLPASPSVSSPAVEPKGTAAEIHQPRLRRLIRYIIYAAAALALLLCVWLWRKHVSLSPRNVL